MSRARTYSDCRSVGSEDLQRKAAAHSQKWQSADFRSPRHAQTTLIAPTGTISFMMDWLFSAEPPGGDS